MCICPTRLNHEYFSYSSYCGIDFQRLRLNDIPDRREMIIFHLFCWFQSKIYDFLSSYDRDVLSVSFWFTSWLLSNGKAPSHQMVTNNLESRVEAIGILLWSSAKNHKVEKLFETGKWSESLPDLTNCIGYDHYCDRSRSNIIPWK